MRYLSQVGQIWNQTLDSAAMGVRMIFGGARWGVSLLLARTRIDYRAEVGDPLGNSIVGATVGWISRNFPEAPVRIKREAATGDEAMVPSGPAGPGYLLRLLERPNRYYSGTLMWMATIVDYVVRGNAYWLKIRADGGRITELWWVPERLMTPAWPDNDPSVFISHYEYVVNDITYAVRPEDVVHFRNGIDPNNVRKGLSRLASLFREIFTDDEAANFTSGMLRNLGVPGVVLAPSNTNTGMINTNPEAVKKSFMEKFGGDKRGEPLVLSAPTDVKVLSWSPSQMNLKDLRRIPEERVSAVLAVPAGVAGLGAGLDRNTFSNYGEANRAAYTQGVIPLQRNIAAELEVQLLVEFANLDREPLDIFFDWTVASAMQEAADAIWKRNESAAIKGLITRRTFKTAVRLPTDDRDDVYIYPNTYNIQPASEDVLPQPARALVPVEPAAIAPTNGHHTAQEVLVAP